MADKKVGLVMYSAMNGETKPDYDMTAMYMLVGVGYYVYTEIDMEGEGIMFDDFTTGDDGSKLNCYKFTIEAFDKLVTQYAVLLEHYDD